MHFLLEVRSLLKVSILGNWSHLCLQVFNKVIEINGGVPPVSHVTIDFERGKDLTIYSMMIPSAGTVVMVARQMFCNMIISLTKTVL